MKKLTYKHYIHYKEIRYYMDGSVCQSIGDISKNIINLDILNPNLKISTMTVTCKLDTLMMVENIGKYIKLNRYGIVTVIPPNGKIRTIIDYKVKVGKKKKISKKPRTMNKSFDNQITILIETPQGRCINIKIFINGSLHLTGCKHSSEIIYAITILTKYLTSTRYLYKHEDKKIYPIVFVTDKDNVNTNQIYDFQIRMINSNFNSEVLIDRNNLCNLLREIGVTCIYEPCTHACVNIKYEYNKNVISIFVFESGSIIITGAKKVKDIDKAFQFIIDLLYIHFDKIVKFDMEQYIKNYLKTGKLD